MIRFIPCKCLAHSLPCRLPQMITGCLQQWGSAPIRPSGIRFACRDQFASQSRWHLSFDASGDVSRSPGIVNPLFLVLASQEIQESAESDAAPGFPPEARPPIADEPEPHGSDRPDCGARYYRGRRQVWRHDQSCRSEPLRIACRTMNLSRTIL
jgi:hypothetical protein